MDNRIATTLYSISFLLLLACPYSVPKVAHYFHGISSRTFQLMPRIGFDVVAALLLGALLVAHIYFYHRLELRRKKLIELCLSILFAVAAVLVYFNVLIIRNAYFEFPVASLFLFAVTLLTALLFGKRPKEAA